MTQQANEAQPQQKKKPSAEEQKTAIELRRTDAEVRRMEIEVRKVDAERIAMLPADAQKWELMQRRANALADSELVPAQYRDKPSNCLIALELADRLGASVLMIMQNTDVIHGNVGFRAKFLVAQVNASKQFTRLGYQWFGEKGSKTWGCRAVAKDRETGQELVGPEVTMQIAHDEGWFAKSGSKWKTIPELMLTYRAGAWWARVHAPETGLGLMTTEELEDIAPSPVPKALSNGSAVDLEAKLRSELAGEVVPHDADGVVIEEAQPKPAERQPGEEG